jgi:undecaprenyl-diphosphatase
MNTDYFIFQQLNNLAGNYQMVEYLAIFFGNYFPYLLGAVLAVFIFLGKNQEEKKQKRIMVGAAFISGLVSRFVFTEIIWFFYFRSRPFAAHSVFQYIQPMTEKSFPSGHAAFFFGLAAAVYFFQKKVHSERSRRAGYWFFAGAFLISVARVFAGIHYPSDILAGAAIGIVTGWATSRILKIAV